MRAFWKRLVLGGVMAVCTVASANAQSSGSLWDHNGSLMRFEAKDEKRRFVYSQPRKALNGAGVKSGTILFDGKTKKDGRLAGYAKLFRKGCQPVDYFVEGAHDKASGEIVLQGQAPIYSGKGCKITGYTDDGSASTLKFTFQSGGDSVYASRDRDERGADEVSRGDRARDQRDRPDYLPPSARSEAGRPSRQEEARRNRPGAGEQEPAYNERGREERDYAARRDRYGRYNRNDNDGDTAPSWRERSRRYDPDAEEEYDEDDPAYFPYQPRWRRYYE